MKIPRDVSGVRPAELLCRKWRYSKVHHRIAIPDHHPLRLGTLHRILRAVARHKAVERNAIIADL